MNLIVIIYVYLLKSKLADKIPYKMIEKTSRRKYIEAWDNLISRKDEFRINLMYLSAIIPLEIYYKYDKLNYWHYGCLSKNQFITWKIVQENSKQNWSFRYLADHKNITLDEIRDNSDMDWSRQFVSKNPNVTNVFAHSTE